MLKMSLFLVLFKHWTKKIKTTSETDIHFCINDQPNESDNLYRVVILYKDV